MNFIEDLEKIQKAHKFLLALDGQDAEKVRVAVANVQGLIGFLTDDIRAQANTGSGERCGQWHVIIDDLVELHKSVKHADSSPIFHVDGNYSSIKAKLRSMG